MVTQKMRCHIRLCTKIFSLWCWEMTLTGAPALSGAHGAEHEQNTDWSGVVVWWPLITGLHHWCEHCKYWQDYGSPAPPTRSKMRNIASRYKVGSLTTLITSSSSSKAVGCWWKLNFWSVKFPHIQIGRKQVLLLKVKSRLQETMFACCWLTQFGDKLDKLCAWLCSSL